MAKVLHRPDGFVDEVRPWSLSGRRPSPIDDP
jgi:hypothetical protein